MFLKRLKIVSAYFILLPIDWLLSIVNNRSWKEQHKETIRVLKHRWNKY